MVLDDLAIYLQAQGLGMRGTTIFEGRLPADAPGGGVADALIVLFPVPGLSPLHVHSIVGPGVEQPVVQVRIRGGTTQGAYAAMWATAEQAFVALDSISNQAINGTFYQRIMALQSPFALPEDEYGRPTLIFNVRCVRESPT